MCTLKAKSKGDRGLKAINNQTLSEPHSRKRMQLYEQDPGLRQTAVCFRSLWGPTWKWEFRGVAWQTLLSVYCSLLFYLWSKKLTTQTTPLIWGNNSYRPNPKETFVFLKSFTIIKLLFSLEHEIGLDVSVWLVWIWKFLPLFSMLQRKDRNKNLQ